MTIKTIQPAEVYRLHQESGAISVVDVREADEFAEVSAPIAENCPLSGFDAASFQVERDKREPIYVLCRSGRRSLKAAQMLAAVGFGSVYNIEGGMQAWEAAGLPVARRASGM